MQYLVDQLVSSGSDRKVKVVDASVVGYMKQLTTAQDLHEMFDSLELATADDILLPVNDSETVLGGGTHWAQLHIQKDRKTA